MNFYITKQFHMYTSENFNIYIKFAYMQKCQIIAYMQIVAYVQKMLHIKFSINVLYKICTYAKMKKSFGTQTRDCSCNLL